MCIIQRVTGCSLGEADNLRLTLRKMNKETNELKKNQFLESALKHGFSMEKAGEIFDILVPLAGYTFNKGHAAAYTKLAYQTAYLKANYQNEFNEAFIRFFPDDM